MPRYYFKIIDEEVVPDLEGTEMADLAAARRAAVDIAAEALKGSGELRWKRTPWRLEVTDDTGELVAALTVTTKADRPA